MSESILIVDDERGIRDTLSAVLRDEGFSAEAVASGEECLKAVERRAYGCVLLDVWLPGIDGLETLRQLRALGCDAAVVIISGHGNIETAVRATKLVARSLHAQSRRAAAPFIEVNSAAIPQELIESELFGHVKGAFTGATAAKKGK